MSKEREQQWQRAEEEEETESEQKRRAKHDMDMDIWTLPYPVSVSLQSFFQSSLLVGVGRWLGLDCWSAGLRVWRVCESPRRGKAGAGEFHLGGRG